MIHVALFCLGFFLGLFSSMGVCIKMLDERDKEIDELERELEELCQDRNEDEKEIKPWL